MIGSRTGCARHDSGTGRTPKTAAARSIDPGKISWKPVAFAGVCVRTWMSCCLHGVCVYAAGCRNRSQAPAVTGRRSQRCRAVIITSRRSPCAAYPMTGTAGKIAERVVEPVRTVPSGMPGSEAPPNRWLARGSQAGTVVDRMPCPIGVDADRGCAGTLRITGRT